MTHNTPAPVADQALAERLARRASVWDSTKRDTDATSNQVLKARALFIDDIEKAYRSGQLITLAEAQATGPSTRRALEIVLSRVPMNSYASQSLMAALSGEITKESEHIKLDEVAMTATVRLAVDSLSCIDKSYTKQQMLTRIGECRSHLRRLLK